MKIFSQLKPTNHEKITPTNLLLVKLALFIFIISACNPESLEEKKPYWDIKFRIGCENEVTQIRPTTDGGFIAAGNTDDAGVVTKLDAWGNVSWMKKYSGANVDQEIMLYAVQQTNDGGYIIAGNTKDGDRGDVWLAKLNQDGTVLWQKTGKGYDAESITCAQQTSDNGYIMAGYTGSFGAGNRDFLVIKFSANGDVLWQKTYGGDYIDGILDIQLTSDNGCIAVGHTMSFGVELCDFWALKLAADGSVEWQKSFSGSGLSEAQSVQQMSDGSFLVSGFVKISDGNSDILLLKLDANGSLIWNKTYGGSEFDHGHSIKKTNDNGFIISGDTDSYGEGDKDIWALKLDSDGNIEWQKTYGGALYDNSTSIIQANDGGYVISGYTASFSEAAYSENCDEKFRQYSWVLKLEPDGSSPPFGADTDCSVSSQILTETITTCVPENSALDFSNTSCVVESVSAVFN